MGSAFKCDKCGELYEGYTPKISKDFVVRIRAGWQKYGASIHLSYGGSSDESCPDLCRACRREILLDLAGGA